MCLDNYETYSISNDFEGFEFVESDLSVTYISPDCPTAYWVTEDLTNYRLIGFKTTISDYY